MLKIGWSTKNVSTNEPVVLHGQFHMRVSRGCLDSLNISSLVIDDGSNIAIFLQRVILRSVLVTLSPRFMGGHQRRRLPTQRFCTP